MLLRHLLAGAILWHPLVIGSVAAQPTVSGNDVVWQGSLPRLPRQGSEIVISTVSGGEPRISLRQQVDGAGKSLSPIPVSVDLQPYASIQHFGADGRCSVIQEGGPPVLRCHAGSSIAGAVLDFAGFRLPTGTSFRLLAEAEGDAGFRAQMTAAGADASEAQPIGIGPSVLGVPVLDVDTRPQLVILAPSAGGELRLRGLILAPETSAERPIETSAWAWTASLWMNDPAGLVAKAKRRGLNRLFVSVDIANGAVLHREALARFIRLARDAAIQVEVVEGDPQMVEPAGLAAATARARALARYQSAAEPLERLAGIQYDVEPYTLAAWGDHPANFSGWADALLALAEAAGEPIDAVLPFWVADVEASREFLNRIRPIVRRVTVMSYRTDAAAFSQTAEPLLAWGAQTGKEIRLALEAGPLVDEIEEIFRPASTGTLAVLPGDTTKVLRLGKDGAVEGARMFKRERRTVIRASRLSFLGNEEGMTALARTSGPAFSAWPSFAGFAFHGLDWSSSLP